MAVLKSQDNLKMNIHEFTPGLGLVSKTFSYWLNFGPQINKNKYFSNVIHFKLRKQLNVLEIHSLTHKHLAPNDSL